MSTEEIRYRTSRLVMSTIQIIAQSAKIEEAEISANAIKLEKLIW
jgi:hypothetical protein